MFSKMKTRQFMKNSYDAVEDDLVNGLAELLGNGDVVLKLVN